jgi:hypothetical protein
LNVDLLVQKFIADPDGSINLSSINQLRAAGTGKLASCLQAISTDTLTGLCKKILTSPRLPEHTKLAVVGDLVKNMRVSDIPILDVKLQADPAAQEIFRKIVMAKGLTEHKLALMRCLTADSDSVEVSSLLRSRDLVLGGARVKPTDVWNHLKLIA